MSKERDTETELKINSTILDSVWHEYPNSIKINNIILKLGDCIIYKTRELPVRIERFVVYEDDFGPIGFEYLPWRGERWGYTNMGITWKSKIHYLPTYRITPLWTTY